MAVTIGEPAPTYERHDLPIEHFGPLTAISRPGGQGRVYRPASAPAELGASRVVVKLYHRPPPPGAAGVLAEMVVWGRSLDPRRRARLHRLTAWPLATLSARGRLVGIAMQDMSGRFSVPFLMPSGRARPVLLALEHLLGGDWYMERRGLPVRLDTVTRARVAERISGAVAFLHQQAIVVGDLAPSNLLVGFADGPRACFIDCDSMLFRGRRALASVETGDWNLPAQFAEPPDTRAADVYKLGLVVLRLFARSHDARTLPPHVEHVPAALRPLLRRALAPDAANRPPAGEWQRALSELIAAGGLSARYPGPARLPPPPPRLVRQPPLRRVRQPPRVTPPPSYSRARRPLSPVLWIALLLVFIVLMSRLLAALPARRGFAPTGGGTPFYYVVPPAGGSPEAR
jgi:serine/threonine protein kinase